MPLNPTLKLLFGLTQPVDRRTYALAGVLLMALKLGVDTLVLYLATGRLWVSWEYMSLGMLDDKVPVAAIRVLALWALPFARIGLSMTLWSDSLSRSIHLRVLRHVKAIAEKAMEGTGG